MATKTIIGDLNVEGNIQRNGVNLPDIPFEIEVSPSGNSGLNIVPSGSTTNVGAYGINILGSNSRNASSTSSYNYNITIGFQSSTVYSSTDGSSNCVVIGSNAQSTQSSWSTVLGTSAGIYLSGACNVAIGSYSMVGGGSPWPGYSVNHSIAVGSGTKNIISKSVTFDGETEDTWESNKAGARTLHLYSPNKIFFRYEPSIIQSKGSLASYTSGHYLSEYIQNNELTANSGLYYLSYTDANNYKTFTKNVSSGTATTIDKKINGVHITIKVSGTTSHSAVGLDLLPYDSTNSYGFDSYGRVIVDGVVQDILGTINSDGLVVITAPSGATIDKVFYSIR